MCTDNASISKKVISIVLMGLLLYSQHAIPVLADTTRIGIVSVWAPNLQPEQKSELLDRLDSELRAVSRLSIIRDTNVKKYLKELSQKELAAQSEIDQAKEHLKAGKTAYFSLELQRARSRLEKAKKLFILNLHRLGSNQELLDSHLFLGMTYVALEIEKKAVAEFRKVAFLDPELELSPKGYSPAVISAFVKAKREIDVEAEANILFESTPKGAELFVNGKSFGPTPLNVNLPIGEYFFRLAKPGHRDWFQVLKVEEGFQKIRKNLAEKQTQEESAALFRIVTPQYPATSQLVQQLTQKAIELQVDILILGETQLDKTYQYRAQLFDARTQEFSAIEWIRAKKDFSSVIRRIPLLAKNLVAHIATTGYIVPEKSLSPKIAAPTETTVQPKQPPPPIKLNMGKDQPMPVAKKSSGRSKVWKKWWFWAIVGGIVTGTSVGIVIASDSDSDKILVDNSGNIP